MPADQETLDLITDYQSTRDPRVGDRLLRRYDAWCRKEAAGATKKFGLNFDDARQAARLALIDAVAAFEPERGIHLLTFASHKARRRMALARAEHHGHSTYVADLRRRIAIAVRQLHAEGAVVQDETVAARMGVGVGVVAAASRREVSMDAPLADESEGTLHDVLAAPADLQPDVISEKRRTAAALRVAIRCAVGTSLSERNAQIMDAYIDAGCEVGSMAVIARELGITTQAVSLSISKSMPRMKLALKLNGYGARRAREMGE